MPGSGRGGLALGRGAAVHGAEGLPPGRELGDSRAPRRRARLCSVRFRTVFCFPEPVRRARMSCSYAAVMGLRLADLWLDGRAPRQSYRYTCSMVNGRQRNPAAARRPALAPALPRARARATTARPPVRLQHLHHGCCCIYASLHGLGPVSRRWRRRAAAFFCILYACRSSLRAVLLATIGLRLLTCGVRWASVACGHLQPPRAWPGPAPCGRG